MDTATIEAHLAAISQRFGLIDAQLALLSEKVGVPFTPTTASVPAEVVELVRSGHALDAIKRYRELTNATLDEARKIVDGI